MVGNVEVKGLISMTHGQELKGGMWQEGLGRMEWNEGGEWDYCISIINKYILKKIYILAHLFQKTVYKETISLETVSQETMSPRKPFCTTPGP